jgi:hypothetical protein
LEKQHGILDVNNVHFRGALPDDVAVKLMRKNEPEWLSKGTNRTWDEAVPADYRDEVRRLSDPTLPDTDRFPHINDTNIKSFHKLAAHQIRGPARLYRILAPNSRAMSDCWISEEIFNKLQNSPDPRATWRKYLAVWPDWNVNGQFVIYDVKAGETLNVWRGPASSQLREAKDKLDAHLEGSWEQIVFKLGNKDVRRDKVLYYKTRSGPLRDPISEADFNNLNRQQKKAYTQIREQINHPNISGPFETGWGYTDFDGKGFLDKIGLPNLSGQTTKVSN